MGVGEQVDDLEKFHPERIANRGLGMGDIVTLVEKAAEIVDQEDAEEMAKIKKKNFDLDDLLSQIRQMKKWVDFGMMKFIPGLSNLRIRSHKILILTTQSLNKKQLFSQ